MEQTELAKAEYVHRQETLAAMTLVAIKINFVTIASATIAPRVILIVIIIQDVKLKEPHAHLPDVPTIAHAIKINFVITPNVLIVHQAFLIVMIPQVVKLKELLAPPQAVPKIRIVNQEKLVLAVKTSIISAVGLFAYQTMLE